MKISSHHFATGFPPHVYKHRTYLQLPNHAGQTNRLLIWIRIRQLRQDSRRPQSHHGENMDHWINCVMGKLLHQWRSRKRSLLIVQQQTLNGKQIQNKQIKVALARPSGEDIKHANLYIKGNHEWCENGQVRDGCWFCLVLLISFLILPEI